MFLSWWDLVVKNRKPLLAIGGVVLGILILFNGAFFVAAYFPKSCVVCQVLEGVEGVGLPVQVDRVVRDAGLPELGLELRPDLVV